MGGPCGDEEPVVNIDNRIGDFRGLETSEVFF
jgi:hypothetical protein